MKKIGLQIFGTMVLPNMIAINLFAGNVPRPLQLIGSSCHRALTGVDGGAIGDFIRNEGGGIVTGLSQNEAVDWAARLRTRLPTIRELAQDATEQGAVVLEVSDYLSGKIPEGLTENDFELIQAKSPSGREDRFYYSFKNYVRQDRNSWDVGNYWLWSSSTHSNGRIYSFFLFDKVGRIGGVDGNWPGYRAVTWRTGTGWQKQPNPGRSAARLMLTNK